MKRDTFIVHSCTEHCSITEDPQHLFTMFYEHLVLQNYWKHFLWRSSIKFITNHHIRITGMPSSTVFHFYTFIYITYCFISDLFCISCVVMMQLM